MNDTNTTLSPAQAASILLERRKIRSSLQDWARTCGFEPAQHHALICDKLEAVERGEIQRLMIFLPPGSAKSTYTSKLFPPWYLGRRSNRTILACSYAFSLAEKFGRDARNLIDTHENTLGISLAKDSKAAGDWETSNHGIFFCAGTNAGIAGRRADLGLIDDPIGSQEDADSKNYRDKQWGWYWNDFIPRLKPGASVVIIANRRHEDDLPGRLLALEGSRWTVIRIPMVAEDEDVLGRQPGDRLWPEYFTDQMVLDAMKNDRTFSSLYQQRPTPESGDFFKAEWLVPYTMDEFLASGEMRFYVGSDHAVSLKQSADKTVLLPCAVDWQDVLWILPDVFWEHASTNIVVEAMLALADRRKPLEWWAGRDHITRSFGPFLKKREIEEGIYIPLREMQETRDKRTRAQAIRGRMEMGMVRFPTFAPWWSDAKHELLTFDSGAHDDFVDALAKVGQGLAMMATPSMPAAEPFLNSLNKDRLTLEWARDSHNRKKRAERMANLLN
jgi:predicted phage terminase large subunit-like protein